MFLAGCGVASQDSLQVLVLSPGLISTQLAISSTSTMKIVLEKCSLRLSAEKVFVVAKTMLKLIALYVDVRKYIVHFAQQYTWLPMNTGTVKTSLVEWRDAI